MWFRFDERGQAVPCASDAGGLLFCRQNGAMCGINCVRVGCHRLLDVLLDMGDVRRALPAYPAEERARLFHGAGHDMSCGLLVAIHQVSQMQNDSSAEVSLSHWALIRADTANKGVRLVHTRGATVFCTCDQLRSKPWCWADITRRRSIWRLF